MREVVRLPRRPATRVGVESVVGALPAASLRKVFTRFWPDTRPLWRWLWLTLVLIIVSPLVGAETATARNGAVI